MIEQVSLSFKGLPNMNGNQPSVGFTIKGNFYVNQDLIKIPIKKQKPKTASALQTIQKSVLILFKHFLDFCLIIRFS
ncbi:hypothetical protein EDB75_00325 [Helicobacter pylori]|nr:hypothetical protein EDB75_00325 [Helicobacter pylori]